MTSRVKRIGIYVIILLVIFLPGSIKYWRLARQKAINQAKLDVFIAENKHIARENKRLREDPVYIEKAARENLLLVKKGEIVLKYKDQQNNTTTSK